MDIECESAYLPSVLRNALSLGQCVRILMFNYEKYLFFNCSELYYLTYILIHISLEVHMILSPLSCSFFPFFDCLSPLQIILQIVILFRVHKFHHFFEWSLLQIILQNVFISIIPFIEYLSPKYSPPL